jgi:hypothetical protein
VVAEAVAEQVEAQLGVGGGVPNPRNDRAASASTAMAKDTDACTMTRPLTLGSTCRSPMAQGPRPAARAAMTYSVPSTCMAPLRTTRTKLGTEAMPIATMATRVLPP